MPTGYAAIPAGAVTLSQGGVVQIALQLPGLVSGVVYEDWDGDGRQQPDELLFRTPFTLTLGAAQMETMGGRGLFLGMTAGSYTLGATVTAVQPQTINLSANTGQGAALAVAAPNSIRGTVWLDGNGDGIRQPWESPLAGVLVMVNGQTAVTDADGRYSFYGIAPGTYPVVSQLPNGLTAQIGPAIVSNGRGAVVGWRPCLRVGVQYICPW